MTSSQEEFIVESTPVVDLKANGLVQTAESKGESANNATGGGSLSHWDSEKTEVLADADADAVAWFTDEAGQKFIIGRFPFFLGRSNECDVVLNGKGVSRKHAEIVFQSGRLVINDLESLNGLKVNGYKVARVILEDNDEVRLGDVTLRFHTGSGSAKSKEAPKKNKVEPVAKPAIASARSASISSAVPNKSSVVRYAAMLSIMVGVIGLMYVTANWYSKKKHVEEAILPDSAPAQTNSAAVAEAPAVAPAEKTPAVAATMPDAGPTLAPPPPPSDPGSAVPPPAPFAPIVAEAAEPSSLPSKRVIKPAKPEPVKAGRAELYPAPPSGVTEAKRDVVPEDRKPPVESRSSAVTALLNQADDRYLRGDAPALFKDLATAQSSNNGSPEDRARLSRKLSSLQSLYSYYAEGKDAYANGDKGKAFALWSQYLAKERSVFPSKRSVYASGVSDVVAGEYVQQADAAAKAGNHHEAYHLLMKASDSGSSSARTEIDSINEQAQNLFRNGLRQEYVNSTKARE
ncbi:MAG TPA: FHA domain-containing protein, partial [Pseudomonadales bacterium]|nr:FHA domain-containing protein [Pseudomonadales bacterium]